MIKNNIECMLCETEFELAYDEEETEINYCPFCGESIVYELEFEND